MAAINVTITAVVVILLAFICLYHQTQAAVFLQRALTFKHCDVDSSDVFTVKRLDVSPYPPKPGDSVSIEGSIESKKTVTGGTVSVSVRKGNLPLLNQSFDLCSVIPTPCPIAQGSTKISIKNDIPNIPFLSGKFDVSIKAKSDQGEELLCVDLKLEIS